MYEGRVPGSNRPGRESSTYFKRPAVEKPARTRYAYISQDAAVEHTQSGFEAIFEPVQPVTAQESAPTPAAGRLVFRKRLFIPAAAVMVIFSGIGGFMMLGDPAADEETGTKPVASTSRTGDTAADRAPTTPVTDKAETAAAAEAGPPAASSRQTDTAAHQPRPRPAVMPATPPPAVPPATPVIGSQPQTPTVPDQGAGAADGSTGVVDENIATDDIGSIGVGPGGQTTSATGDDPSPAVTPAPTANPSPTL